jgi:hypothetical protein
MLHRGNFAIRETHSRTNFHHWTQILDFEAEFYLFTPFSLYSLLSSHFFLQLRDLVSLMALCRQLVQTLHLQTKCGSLNAHWSEKEISCWSELSPWWRSISLSSRDLWLTAKWYHRSEFAISLLSHFLVGFPQFE